MFPLSLSLHIVCWFWKYLHAPVQTHWRNTQWITDGFDIVFVFSRALYVNWSHWFCQADLEPAGSLSRPASFSSNPCRPHILLANAHTQPCAAKQCAAYKYIFHRPWNSYLFYSCPIMATHCSEMIVMGISVVSASMCCSMRSFIWLSKCNPIRGWLGNMTCHIITSHHRWTY